MSEEVTETTEAEPEAPAEPVASNEPSEAEALQAAIEENAELRMVLKSHVNVEDLDSYLNDHVKYNRDGSPYYIQPQSEGPKARPPRVKRESVAPKERAPVTKKPVSFDRVALAKMSRQERETFVLQSLGA